MYEYLNEEHTTIRRLSDGAFIPADPRNRDYEDVMEWVAQGNVITPWSAPTPTSTDVNKERDRRMEIFTFGGKEYAIRQSDGSLSNVSGAGTLALGAMVAGAQPGNLRWADPNVDFTWIAEDNTVVTMDAQTTWAFAQSAAAWRKQMIYNARSLKDLPSIPANYADNTYWD